MFNRTREFNIISGERNNVLNSRALSCADQVQKFKDIPQAPLKLQKLGAAKDRKQFQYSYVEPQGMLPPKTQPPFVSVRESVDPSSSKPYMMNYVSTQYNIINHKQPLPTAKIVTRDIFAQKVVEANRQNPLTKLIHQGRLVAPNYHEDYAERQKNRQFVRKRGGLCQFVCDIEKSYGVNKYFRKYK